jgi:hypothetical protein
MKPITRQMIDVDRRQPVLRWSAVFAGGAASVALWVLFQMIGMGVGLAAVEIDAAGWLRDVGIGSTVWTLVAPLVAIFIGSMIAGRLAGSVSRGIGAMHGFVTWALTSVLGLLVTIGVVTIVASGAIHTGVVLDAAGVHQMTATKATSAQAVQATGAVLLAAGISLAASLLVSLAGGALGVRRRIARDDFRDLDARRDGRPAREVGIRLPAAPDAPHEMTVPVVPR